jgi:uncharacterized protein (DUF2249 family)
MGKRLHVADLRMESRHEFTFPFLVRLDDGEVMQIESYDKILYHLEAIDIENNEYLFWDAEGRGVKVVIKNSKVKEFRETDNGMTVQNAIGEYARHLGTTAETTGTPLETWRRMQGFKDGLPRPRGLFSRLFGSGTK